MSGQDYEQLMLFQGDSHASRTALQESEKEQKMKGISGQNLCELSGNYTPGMLLVRMCQDYYLQFMTMFAPTWKVQVTKSKRCVYRLTLSVRTMRDTGFVLLASPRASQDYKPIRRQTPQEHCGKHGNALCASLGIICPERIGQYISHRFAE